MLDKRNTTEMKQFIVEQLKKVDSGAITPAQAAVNYTGLGRYISLLSLEQEQSRLYKRGEVDHIEDFDDSTKPTKK